MKLDRARWWLLREHPFYGQLTMGLADALTQEKTASTNGTRIKWGREFLSGLTDEETRFVLAHETMHCAHGHLWRLPTDERGNQAGDYVINEILAPVKGMAMPHGGLRCPPEWAALSEEEICHRLPPPQDGRGEGQPGDGCGQFEEPDGEDKEDLQQQWEERIIQARVVAEAQKGQTPDAMGRILERLAHQPIDWRKEMADFVRSVISTRNDWSRPARRHSWQSVIYPRRKPDQLGTIVFARDTSGSIDQDLCAEFSAHITAALADAGCAGIVLDCDVEIQDEIALAPGEECPLTAKGGGGTSHIPVFGRVAELTDSGEHIAGVVCLTDLETDFPVGPDVPTLWITKSRSIAPFGRTVRVE